MPAKKKRTPEDSQSVYKVTYSVGVQYGTGMQATTSKDLKATNWQVVDGLVTFYGSGPRFVLPERLLISIERLDRLDVLALGGEGMNGYEQIGSIETADYSWSAVGTWRQTATGRIYWATDGGCSCYSAWQDTTEADLKPLTADSLAEFEGAARAVDQVTNEDINEFIQQARDALAAAA